MKMLRCTSCRKRINPALEHVKLEDSKAGRDYYFHNTGCADSAYRLAFAHRGHGRRVRVIRPERKGD